MLSGLESFKAGFLTRCVEEGISTDEALSRVKTASDQLDVFEKQAGDGPDPTRWHYHGTGDGSDPENWEYLSDDDERVQTMRKRKKKQADSSDVDFISGLKEPELRDELAARVRLIEQLRSHRDTLLDRMVSGEKQADIPGYGIVKDLLKGVAGLAKPVLQKGLDVGTSAALFGPLALGGAAGYGVSKMTDVDEEDVDDVKKQELIDEYKRQADRLRQSKSLRAYRKRRKASGGVYL